MSVHDRTGNLLLFRIVGFRSSCCQKPTTKHKRHHQNFINRPLNWEFVAICMGCTCRSIYATSKQTLQKGIIGVVGICFLSLISFSTASAQVRKSVEQINFEDERVLWNASSSRLSELIKSHQNIDFDSHTGSHCEQFIFNSTQYIEEERLELEVPPSRVYDEFQSSIWIRTNCPDVRLMLRLRFPNQLDPRTGQQLTLDLSGDRYSTFGKWQRIGCQTTEAAINQRLNLARAALSSQGNPVEIDAREVFVDQMALLISVRQGESALQIDDVHYGPIVPPNSQVMEFEPKRTVKTRLKIFDDRILKDEAPFFPVFTLYHGESLDDIRTTGVNALWIPDYADQPLLQALAEMDIGAFAQPPQLTPEEAVLNRKGLPAFQDWTEPIWAWMFGYEIPEDDVRYLASWSQQVRAADQHMRRPILADVTGNERAFHRKVELLGSSQFVINTSVSMPRHAKQLKHRRNMALPGKPMFTLVQTEAATPFLDQRTDEQALPIVEPEQILHQGYAAIAAGFKGVGFWKQIPFDAQIPGLNERIHAIRLFALHAQILQPWLATGRVVDDIPVRLDSGDAKIQAGLYGPLKSRWDTPIEQASATQNQRQSEILATVIRSDDGILILPVWYEENEQCVPGPQAASGIRMLLKGDIWQAWEVTPVGVTQSNLEVSWPAGGTEIYLKEFDQQSAIIITDKPAVIERLQKDCRRVRNDAARSMVTLAGLKFERVQKVHLELQELNATIPHAELFLKQAYSYLETSNQEIESSHPVEAYASACKSLQYLRMLQRQYWEAANQDLPSVVTSLDATGFQTLPDHWKMLQEVGTRQQTSPNLIPTGDFEDADALPKLWRNGSSEVGKKMIQRQQDQLRNDYHLSLQLESTPGESGDIVLASPEVEVFAGDLVVITAQVRVNRPFLSAQDEFLIFDTLVGSHGAVRFTDPKKDWQTVKIVRKISRDARFRVRLELRGNGHVDIDDLRVHRLLP